jgi:hypothetical protein
LTAGITIEGWFNFASSNSFVNQTAFRKGFSYLLDWEHLPRVPVLVLVHPARVMALGGCHGAFSLPSRNSAVFLYSCGESTSLGRDWAGTRRRSRDERVTGAQGDDAACYRRVLLTDARSCNLPAELARPRAGRGSS